MSKVYGLKTEFAYFRENGGRYAIGYGMESVDETHATWYEVYYYKKQHPNVNYKDVKDAIIGDINARTDAKILNGFVWNGKPVYLSEENQKNFSEAQRVAQMTDGQNLPIKFKLGEDEDGNPVYHTFTAITALTDFYLRGVAYINQTLNEGWTEKDGIDWSPYEALFPEPTPANE